MDTIKIEKNVALPAPSTKYPFREMKKGDSFLVQRSKLASIHTAARYAGIEVKTSIKDQPEGMLRVWRMG